MVFVVLCLASFPWHDVLDFHPHCSKRQILLPFKAASFPIACTSTTTCPSIRPPIHRHAGCCHLLATVNNAAESLQCKCLLYVFTAPQRGEGYVRNATLSKSRSFLWPLERRLRQERRDPEGENVHRILPGSTEPDTGDTGVRGGGRREGRLSDAHAGEARRDVEC